jgi:hypothetical protein
VTLARDWAYLEPAVAVPDSRAPANFGRRAHSEACATL